MKRDGHDIDRTGGREAFRNGNWMDGETTGETSARRPGGCLAKMAVRQNDKPMARRDLAAE